MSKRGRGLWDVETGGVDTAGVLMLLARQYNQHAGADVVGGSAQPLVARGVHGRVFECKTCNRQFPTFQALGGHRASHKRPKLHQPHALGAGADAALCLGRQPQAQQPPAKPRVHECPVCGLEFAIGQALGGHMRRHRAEAEAEAPNGKAAPEKAWDVGGICLDLNLTPSENCAKCRNVVGFGAAGQGVHKALAMLDCLL